MGLHDLAPELLIEILKKLDAKSLRQFCLASSHVRTVVKSYTGMHYNLELELTGMKDGPARNVPISVRRDKLLDFKHAFPTLGRLPRHTFEISLSPPSGNFGDYPFRPLIGVSGGIFYHTRMGSPRHPYVVELHDLPCPRVYPTRRFRTLPAFAVPHLPRTITVDAPQSLLVISKIHRLEEFSYRVVLYIRRLVTDPAHQQAVSREVEFNFEVSDDEEFLLDHVDICGRMVGMTVNMGRTSKLCIVDVGTGKTIIWKSDVLSFQFLNESRILIVSPIDVDETEDEIPRPSSKRLPLPSRMLEVHSLDSLNDSEEAVKCAYQLPGGSFDIQPNLSTVSSIPSGLMFYPDPARRLIVLVASSKTERHMRLIVLRESSLSQARRGCGSVRWEQWSRDCLVKDIQCADPSSLQVVGNRILFLEIVPDPRHVAGPSSRRIHLLDFNPHVLECLESGMGYVASVRSGEIKAKFERHSRLPFIHSQTGNEIDISDFFATEDNLILVNYRGGQARVKVLTFDRPPLASSLG